MYILNEKKYIEEVIKSGKKPDDLSMGYFISLLARYYFDKETKLDDFVDSIKKKIVEFKMLGYQEYKYAGKIKTICIDLYENESSRTFKELDYIPIYESELSVISSLQNDRQRKFLFTLYALARYMNTDGWINKKDSKSLSEVFKLANITLTNDKRNELLNAMYSSGYIYFGKKIDNLNIKVNLIPEGEVIYKLTEFQNIGNQYIGNFKKGYKQCQRCGKKIKYIGKKKLYCDDCGKEVNKLQTKERMKNMRETQKCLK